MTTSLAGGYGREKENSGWQGPKEELRSGKKKVAHTGTGIKGSVRSNVTMVLPSISEGERLVGSLQDLTLEVN
jgi:hypothetical protein